MLVGLVGIGQDKGNYIIVIGEDSAQTDLNRPFQYTTPEGEKLSIKIVQADIQTYSDDMISFSHDKSLSVSNTDIEYGIEQCMIMKATGNGFMVQKYKTMNPDGMNRLFLNEITKESVSYGYSKSESDFKKELKSGHIIQGIQATLTYKGQKEVYTVASYGGKDEGVVVVTMLLSEEFDEDREIIELFLNTLELKLP